MNYIQLHLLTVSVLMTVFVLGAFLPPLRRALISFFDDLDTAEPYVSVLEEAEDRKPWPAELKYIYLRILRVFVGYALMFFLSFFASLFWPILWIAAALGLFAVIVWVMKRRGIGSDKVSVDNDTA